MKEPWIYEGNRKMGVSREVHSDTMLSGGTFYKGVCVGGEGGTRRFI